MLNTDSTRWMSSSDSSSNCTMSAMAAGRAMGLTGLGGVRWETDGAVGKVTAWPVGTTRAGKVDGQSTNVTRQPKRAPRTEEGSKRNEIDDFVGFQMTFLFPNYLFQKYNKHKK